MPRGPTPPSAPWLEDEELEVFDDEDAVMEIALTLARSLETRAKTLRDDPSPERVFLEVRRQAAAAVAAGDLGFARELMELAMHLHEANAAAESPV